MSSLVTGANKAVSKCDLRPRFMDIPIDPLTLEQTVQLASEAVRERRRLQHVVVNVAKVVKARTDSLLRQDIIASDVVSVDGMGVVWGCRLLGIRVPERVTGIDLMYALLALAEREGYRPFILGATPATLSRAVEQIARRYPRLFLAGSRDGYFPASESEAVVAEIRESRADMLFIAMPTPQKERFLATFRDELSVPFLMGVGGSIDVLSGDVCRAPTVLQRMGLEWAYRTYQEPRRLWKRYFTTNALFATLLLREWVRQQFARHA